MTSANNFRALFGKARPKLPLISTFYSRPLHNAESLWSDRGDITLAKELINKVPNPPCKFGTESVKKYCKHLNLGRKPFTLNSLMIVHQFWQNQLQSFGISPSPYQVFQECTQAKLNPLFKKGNKDKPKSHRPISLLPQISKELNKLSTSRYNNTDACLSYLSVKVMKGFENRMFTGMILINLQKAFDTIGHKIFLQKMKHVWLC